MTRPGFLLTALLTGCAGALPPVPAPAPPAGLTSCPAPGPAPPVLPAVVTTDRLRSGFHALELALASERARLLDCAGRLAALNSWISDHVK
jgi:hypothetical protein